MDAYRHSQGARAGASIALWLGGSASAVGFLGALWSLYEMKRGWIPAVGRWLLIALTIVPLAVGAIFLGGGVGYFAPIPLPAEKGSVLVVMGLQFGILSLALGIIFLLARPLQAATPLRRRFGSACLALAACAAVGSALLAKRGDYHWPHVFYSEEAKLKLFSDLRPQDDQVLALLKRAAGPFADDYELSVSNGVARVVALTRQNPTRGERGMGKSKARDIPHASACLARLRDLLPPAAVRECVIRSDESFRDPSPRNALAVLASIAALLAALAGGRRAVWVVIGGVALHGVLIALPVWPSGNAAPPRLIDAAPLPPLTVTELPAPDFSTPELAVASVYDARCFGRLDVAKRGVSKEFAAIIEEHRDGWEGFMSRFNGDQDARRFAVLESERDKKDDGLAVVRGRFEPRDNGRNLGEARSVVVFEDGKWKLDNLDSRYRATPRARHEAAATMRAAPSGPVESWSYRARHLSPDAIQQSTGWRQERRSGGADAVAFDAKDEVVTLTGPRDRVRRLATLLRGFDRGGSDDFMELALSQSPEFMATGVIPFLITVETLDQAPLTEPLRAQLKKESVSAPQLARALSGHVLEVEKASFDNEGLTLDDLTKNPKATVVTKASIPCADQPAKPLEFEIHYRKNDQPGVTIVAEIGSFSPWLIEEAKEQLKEPVFKTEDSAGAKPAADVDHKNSGKKVEKDDTKPAVEARLKELEAYITSTQPKVRQYRAVCRVEVRLKKGNTEALLNEALGKFCTVVPVPGVKDQFDLVVTDPDPAQTSRFANYLAENAEKLLQEREVHGSVRIVKPAERPEKPIDADERPGSPQSPTK